MTEVATLALLVRIADALDRLAPPPAPELDLDEADAFVWAGAHLQPIRSVSRVALGLLQGVQHQRDTLLANTSAFASGRPANNALLWGARGMGKSSLVKAVHAHVNEATPHAPAPHRLALVEIHREDIATLPALLSRLALSPRRFILFCDDLSFDAGETQYKSLKAVLDGGIEGRPANVLFYATSNRRHLMPREMIDNERSSAINPGEAVEEKVSLSDRFGLWIGFHACDQDTYLAMVEAYATWFALPIDADTLRSEAIAWSMGRGSRSGRVAWQFIEELRGRA